MSVKLRTAGVILPLLLSLGFGWAAIATPANRQPSKPNNRIAEGIYWVGPTGVGLRVQKGRYQMYDEGGKGPWRPISELKPVKEGVILAGKTYWCLSTRMPSRTTGLATCSANGWVRAR